MSQITKTGPLAWWMAGRGPAEPQQESSSASIGLMTIAREAHPAVRPSRRVDFTRAFRLHKDLKDPKDLVRCDRQLFDKLKSLDGNELAARTKSYLTTDEVKAVLARRDKIVEQFQKLIAEKVEKEVLY